MLYTRNYFIYTSWRLRNSRILEEALQGSWISGREVKCCWVLQCVLQCIAVCCSMLLYVPVCFSVLQCVAVRCSAALLSLTTHCNTLQHSATRCNTQQHTATRCNTLQHTATHCNKPSIFTGWQIDNGIVENCLASPRGRGLADG